MTNLKFFYPKIRRTYETPKKDYILKLSAIFWNTLFPSVIFFFMFKYLWLMPIFAIFLFIRLEE